MNARIKIAQHIDVEVPGIANSDTIFEAANTLLNGHTQFKDNLDFVIEEVNGDSDHPLVNEMVGN